MLESTIFVRIISSCDFDVLFIKVIVAATCIAVLIFPAAAA